MDRALRKSLIVSLLALSAANGATQNYSASIPAPYRVVPNITYVTANNYDVKLDVYSRTDLQTPLPTMIWFHGGGWMQDSKDSQFLFLVPYLEIGWNVVNVEYRRGYIATAPAAVEDCLCALRWVIRNSREYGFDTAKLIAGGLSAGGHLALTTAMIPESAGLDRQCPGTEELKVAAVVDWYGVTDVADLLDGPNMRSFAVAWVGSTPNRIEITKRVSPMSYVRAGLPPIISIHGDADEIVPYSHSVRLQSALKQAGVDGELVTIPGAKHGNFTQAENHKAYTAVKSFLGRHGLLPVNFKK